MTEKTKEKKGKETRKIVGTRSLGTRGRTFRGTVTKKFEKRVVVEFERTVRVLKYERFAKKKTRLHARLPEGISVHVGDSVKVRECRPLSKIVHFVVTEIVKRQEKKK